MNEKERYFMASVTLGPKGQIVIPKEVREMFGIGPGDTVALLADKKRGMAMQTPDSLQPFLKEAFDHLTPEEESE